MLLFKLQRQEVTLQATMNELDCNKPIRYFIDRNRYTIYKKVCNNLRLRFLIGPLNGVRIITIETRERGWFNCLKQQYIWYTE